MKFNIAGPQLGFNGPLGKRNDVTTELLGRYRIVVFVVVVSMPILFSLQTASAQKENQVIRLARLVIDSTRLESYKAALKEEIETSLRVEAGVLSLSAVSEKSRPTHITILEIYADDRAYKAHLETPHFKKYKNATKEMVRSLELIETVPIALGAKSK